MNTIKELSKKLISKEISSVEITEEYLKNIKNNNGEINAYITVCEDEALKMARKADELIAKGEVTPLTGIPLAIKDNISTKGIRTTCASKMLEDFVPVYDATSVSRLKNDGAVILGKTNMDEFAMGSTTKTSYFGPCKNPVDTSKVPGGSSGGSAAAVKADMCAASLGSDTGGSIRQPSAFCGVTGIKPTYGTVSRFGLVAFGSSLDQIGPIANSAYDCGLILNSIAGFDKNDYTSKDSGISDFNGLIGQSIKGTKIGIPKEYFADGIDDEVKESVMKAAQFYKENGAELIEVSLPSLKYAVSAYYLLACAEASSNLARFDGVRYGYRTPDAKSYDELIKKTRYEGFGKEVQRRILLGTYALSSGYYDAYYKKALAVRQQFIKDHNEIFSKCDCMITPTVPSPAYGLDANIDDSVKLYLADICTVSANIAGLPSMSTTCGYSKEKLPIGFSITADKFNDAKVIQLVDAFENSFVM